MELTYFLLPRKSGPTNGLDIQKDRFRLHNRREFLMVEVNMPPHETFEFSFNSSNKDWMIICQRNKRNTASSAYSNIKTIKHNVLHIKLESEHSKPKQ